jgi:alpha/beta superfamily hydrolase
VSFLHRLSWNKVRVIVMENAREGAMERIRKNIYIYFSVLFMSSCAFDGRFYEPRKDSVSIDWTLGEEGFFMGSSGQNLSYLYVKPENKEAIASVLILHGNDGNLASCKNIVMPFVENGYQVYVFDYQGFGKSEGRPTHKNLLDDAESFPNYIRLRSETENKKLLVAGFSLGGQLSIALTSRNQNKIDALMVEGTFTSHKDIAVYTSTGVSKVFAKILVSSGHNAKELLSGIAIPKLIVLSYEDEVNPYFMGVELFDAAISPKMFWAIKGAHIEGFEHYEEAYIRKIHELLSLSRVVSD